MNKASPVSALEQPNTPPIAPESAHESAPVLAAEYEQRIQQLSIQLHHERSKLQQIYRSATWRMTEPLRKLDGLIHSRLLGYTRAELAPMHQLERLANGQPHAWRSLGEDPQFLIQPANPAVLRRAGWALLSFDFEAQGPAAAQLFFDIGMGYQMPLSLTFTARGKGRVTVPIYLPHCLQTLRLDPCANPGDFRISRVKIKQLNKKPRIDPAHESVLGHLQTQDTLRYRLVPVHQLVPNTAEGYQWLSTGDDPHFLLEPAHNQRNHTGWTQVRLQIQIEGKRGRAKLYFDTGSGFSEAQTLSIPFENGVAVSRVGQLPDNVVRIRFDPLDMAGQFNIQALHFESITQADAEMEIVKRLAQQHPSYQHLSPQEIRNQLTALATSEARPLLATQLGAYADTFQTRPVAEAYEEWIEQVEKPSLPDEITLQAALARREKHPLISVVMPVYNTPEVYLRACIDSVRQQSWPHWELCIADDASPKPHVRRILQEYEQLDPRIRVVYRSENGHISEASNSALAIAQGEYVALLDHDDLLPPHALYFVAQAIEEHPQAAFFYSDEDKIDRLNKRFDPHFKSSWNPDLFYAQNYVSHLGVYQHNLLQQVGGFRKGVEGSQDHDLLLRCLPLLKSGQIVHIPHVLYHWRTLEGSTALASGEKSYTTEAGLKALNEHFAKSGPPGTLVEPGLQPNTYRVRWPVPTPAPRVSLLIPTRDRKTITEVAVRSILEKTTYPNYEITILDNGSVEPETLAFFDSIQKEDPRVRVLPYNHPFNFSAINNFGVKHTSGDIVGLINNDVEVISPEWLTEMVSHACRPDVGCVGAKLYFSNGSLQHAGIILGIGGVAGHSHKYFKRNAPGYFSRLALVQSLSAVTAACLIVRREVYEQVAGLDEDNLHVAFNDVDFCLKVREAGYRNLWTPYAELYHHESISRGNEDTPEKQERFVREVRYMEKTWGDKLTADPYYNRNLSHSHEDFSIIANR